MQFPCRLALTTFQGPWRCLGLIMEMDHLFMWSTRFFDLEGFFGPSEAYPQVSRFWTHIHSNPSESQEDLSKARQALNSESKAMSEFFVTSCNIQLWLIHGVP